MGQNAMGTVSRIAWAFVGLAALAATVATGAPSTLNAYATSVAPLDPDRVVVFAFDTSGAHWVTTSTDGGATWGAPVGTAKIFFAPQQAIALGRGSVLLVVDDGGAVARSDDGGSTWKRTFRGHRWVAGDATRPGYAWGVNGAGTLFRSTNSAVTWRRVMPRQVGGCTSVATQPGTRVVLAACGFHIWRSTNAGVTWRPAGPTPYPLPDNFRRAVPIFESVTFDPTRPGVAVANVDMFTTNRPQIWRSVNGGRTWKRAVVPNVSRRLPPGRPPTSGQIRVTAGAGLIVAGPYARSSARVMLSSSNGGVTWKADPLDTLLPGGPQGGSAMPDPTLASGSAPALFMPVRRAPGQVLVARAGAAGWTPLTFFTPPLPPLPLERQAQPSGPR